MSRARFFEEVERIKALEKDNKRMLDRFLEIQAGHGISVGRSNPAENIKSIASSPSHEFHSLSVLNKLEESHQMYQSNLRLAERLKAIEGTVTAAELSKKWKETKRIRNMARHSKISNSCLNTSGLNLNSANFEALSRSGILQRLLNSSPSGKSQDIVDLAN